MSSQFAIRMNAQVIDYQDTDTSRWGAWTRLMLILEKQSTAGKWGIVLSLMLAIAWLDQVTGWELSLLAVYALPILLAVRLIGRNAGVALAILHGPIWWIANESNQPYTTAWGYNWMTISRVIVFALIAVGANAIRSKQEGDKARIAMLEQVRRLQAEIVSASEYEQQRIGQDLHDGLCQQLAAIGCAARALAEDLQAHELAEAQDAEKIEFAIQQAVMEARSLARGIFPVHVDRTGLSIALSELAQNTQRLTGTAIEIDDVEDVYIESPEVAMHLYRIAQEAVANAVRHSGASQVVISLLMEGNHLKLTIDDNGRGIEAGEGLAGLGMGLRTMHYRAHAMGAELDIAEGSHGGTSVCCSLKVNATTTSSHHEHV